MDVVPALGREENVSVSPGPASAHGRTYNTPMLIATRTPIFSFLVMERLQIIFHGRTDKVMSMAPEYAGTTRQHTARTRAPTHRSYRSRRCSMLSSQV